MQNGGGLVCGATPWGWLEGTEGKLLTDFPFTRFCDYIGIKLTDNCAECSDPIEFQGDLVKFKNIHHVVQELAHNPNDPHNLMIVGSAIKELGDTLPGVPIETLHHIVMSASKEVTPENTCPIKKKDQRQKSTGVCGIMCRLPGIKAPGKR